MSDWMIGSTHRDLISYFCNRVSDRLHLTTIRIVEVMLFGLSASLSCSPSFATESAIAALVLKFWTA